MRKRWSGSLLLLGLICGGTMVWAEDGGGMASITTTASAPAGVMEDRLRVLEHSVATLQRQQDELAAKKPAEAPPLSAGRDGFALKSTDGAYQLKIKGLLQLDGRTFLADEKVPGVSTFLLRRVRPFFEGTLAKRWEFKLIPDFGGGTVTLLDAYLEYKIIPELNIRGGRFKVPVGLERLQSSAATSFVEPALATNLTPSYDLGLLLSGDVFDGWVAYQVGVLNGAADNASADADTYDYKDLAGRLMLQPFKFLDWKGLQGLSVGCGGSYGKILGSVSTPGLPSYKSPGQLTFFSYRTDGSNSGTAVAQGDLRRLAPQCTYYCGPLFVLGEYVASLQPVKLGNVTQDIRNEAWQATAGYVLTGEKASFNGVTPNAPLDPAKGEWGAWEVVGRYSQLLVSADAFPIYADPAKSAKRAKAWAYGVNWYMSKQVKVQMDYEQTVYEYGAAGNGTRENESVILTRIQCSY